MLGLNGQCAFVVQLAEQKLPVPGIRGSNPYIDLIVNCLRNVALEKLKTTWHVHELKAKNPMRLKAQKK